MSNGKPHAFYMKTTYTATPAFITKDGFEIRELMHPTDQPVRNQSLAEARVAPGQTTALHRHRKSEELYLITAGCGRMTLDDQQFDVEMGDTVCIPPGTPNCITNTGSETLCILCCCSPSYAQEDTDLLEPVLGVRR